MYCKHVLLVFLICLVWGELDSVYLAKLAMRSANNKIPVCSS